MDHQNNEQQRHRYFNVCHFAAPFFFQNSLNPALTIDDRRASSILRFFHCFVFLARPAFLGVRCFSDLTPKNFQPCLALAGVAFDGVAGRLAAMGAGQEFVDWLQASGRLCSRCLVRNQTTFANLRWNYPQLVRYEYAWRIALKRILGDDFSMSARR